MNKKVSVVIFSTLFLGLLLMPIASFAQGQSGFDDPLEGTTVPILITNVVNFLLGIVFLLALLALVVGGVRMVGSFGNEQQVAAAKKIILWALIGLAVALLSWVIIRILADEIIKVA